MKRDNVVGERAWTLSDLDIRSVPLEDVLTDCIGPGLKTDDAGRRAP